MRHNEYEFPATSFEVVVVLVLVLVLDLKLSNKRYAGTLFCLCDYSLQRCDYYSITGFHYGCVFDVVMHIATSKLVHNGGYIQKLLQLFDLPEIL